MARIIPADMRARDLIDAEGARLMLNISRGRIHQLAQEGKLRAYIFIDGELAEAEGLERQGHIALFNRNEVANLVGKLPGRGRTPRKTSFPTSQ